jgi:hypothetical protein
MSLLTQIGRIATTSAIIKQEIILHTSALAAQDTDGKPSEDLTAGFARLLESRWYPLAKKHLGKDQFNKFAHPLNSKLRQALPIRGHIIHGRWYPEARGRYRVEWWEQTDDLRDYQASYTLKQITAFADDLDKMLEDIYYFHDTGLPPSSQKKSKRLRHPTNRSRDAKPVKP